MITLAFDSTAKAASVAVTDGERPLAIYTVENGLTQSELLLPMAEAALASLKLTFSDVELLAASVGPGSFTGVRIGTALVKGIAFGKNIPCASVSTLEALAENLSGLDGIIVPVMDARRGQVYTALFSCTGGEIERLTDDLAISIDELAEKLSDYCEKKKIYLCGDGYNVVKRAFEKIGLTTESTPLLLISENAYSVAAVAQRIYQRGECTADTEHNPTYLRVPQAERERLERLKEN
jgi:tRNA threonylcarbamoyladenosine biosynthesis protein TsaB